MDRWKYYDVLHRNHTILDPMSEEKLDELIRLLDLPPGAKVFDAGCGKAEPLIRIAQRYQIMGIGIDKSPYFVRDARRASSARVTPPSSLTFEEMDAAQYRIEPATLDLAMCLGATWIWGGFRGTLTALATMVRPGGQVLVGEPYWRQTPSPEYLAASGDQAETFSTHVGNVQIGQECGLRPLYAMVSSEDDWDRYEWLRVRAAECYAWQHPEDPDIPEILTTARHGRDTYLKYGRATMGWAMYLFLKP